MGSVGEEIGTICIDAQGRRCNVGKDFARARDEGAFPIRYFLTGAINDMATPFQDRVQPWMLACFGEKISADTLERDDRLLEEVLELLQSGDYPPERIAALTRYVYDRPKGEPVQETGGVMVTLAARCLARGIDMHAAGEAELARIWTKVDAIRAKQAAKPTGSALPVAPSDLASQEGEHSGEVVCKDFCVQCTVDGCCEDCCHCTTPPAPDDAASQAAQDVLAERRRQVDVEGWTPEHDDSHAKGEMARAAGIYAVVAGGDATDYRNALQSYYMGDVHEGLMQYKWPWDRSWFKPTDRRRDLVKAGALILAEIERLDRQGDAP
ncbi:hypothetical protein AB4037_29080 [Labrys sp. KB_33_2]|uniref:hypothetical protein n=1 Tax=Labrys sp. KB_33_2 TaxID=3237479 RepID=UPI003F9237A6